MRKGEPIPRPIAAIVGRPNVGKSTLVNRLAGGRRAIVDVIAGVTRDRNYIEADWNGRDFILIDTGGLDPSDKEPMAAAIMQQAMAAVSECDLVVFVVDAQTGLVGQDQEIASILRASRKPVLLVVNKVDNPREEDLLYPFFRLGLGDPVSVCAAHGLKIGDLLDSLVERLPDVAPIEVDPQELRVAIVGRPNAGKSSLFNRVIGEERALVSEKPGTTRDAIDTVVKAGDHQYRFIDTAGLRKVAKLSGDIEYYGILRAHKALESASVAVLVIDSAVGITYQDQRIARLAGDKRCALIIALNKWDLVDQESAERLGSALIAKLGFVNYAIVLKTCATTGKGLHKLLPAIDRVAESFNKKLPTSALNKFLLELRQTHLPSKKGKSLKLKYITQLRTEPPTFLIFVNDTRIPDDAYRRFLDKKFRGRFDLEGTPLSFQFRRGD